MKQLFGILILILSINFSTAQGIDFFHGTFDEAKEQAKAEGKLIFMDAYAVWCGPCKMMTNKVFPQESVGDFFNANFINMKVDMEKGEGLELRRTYGVTAYPTMMLIDGDGKVVEMIKGARGADALIAWAKKSAIPNQGAVDKLQEKYDAGDRSQGLMKDLINVKAAYNQDYDDLFAEFLASLSEEDKISNENASFIFSSTNNTKSPGLAVLKSYQSYYADIKGDGAFDTKVTSIAKKTAATGLKEKKIEFVDEAAAFLKDYKPANYKEISSELYVTFYGKTKDWEKYDVAVTKHLAKYKKGDDKAYRDVAWNYYMEIDNEAQLRKAEKWMQKNIASNNSYENNLTQAYLLYKLEAFSEAEDAVNYALILAGEKKKTKNAQILKDEILKKLNKTQNPE